MTYGCNGVVRLEFIILMVLPAVAGYCGGLCVAIVVVIIVIPAILGFLLLLCILKVLVQLCIRCQRRKCAAASGNVVVNQIAVSPASIPSNPHVFVVPGLDKPTNPGVIQNINDGYEEDKKQYVHPIRLPMAEISIPSSDEP